MEISILVISILSFIIGVVAVILCVKLLHNISKMTDKGFEENNQSELEILNDKIQRGVKDLGNDIQREIRAISSDQQKSFIELSKLTTEQLQTGLDRHSQNIDKNIDKMVTLLDTNVKNLMGIQERSISGVESRLDKISRDITDNLANIRQDNSAQLERMREVVDEKLNKTLDERLNRSFSAITEQLDKVKEGFFEMQNLSKGVTDLNKVLNGVKTRGTWGETSLQCLLEDILIPDQFVKNAQIKQNKLVEFCIKLPGNDGEPVLLPIDSKFPLADYQKLVECSESGDIDGLHSARKNLIQRIKEEAKSIYEYIVPPKTTDFAIMYLPIEGLFAEISKYDELVENIRKKYNVIISGPSTFAALLNSLQVGFRTLALQKNSLEIQKVLVAFKAEFTKFESLLNKSERQASQLQETLHGVVDRTVKIDKKLKGIEINDNINGIETVAVATALIEDEVGDIDGTD